MPDIWFVSFAIQTHLTAEQTREAVIRALNNDIELQLSEYERRTVCVEPYDGIPLHEVESPSRTGGSSMLHDNIGKEQFREIVKQWADRAWVIYYGPGEVHRPLRNNEIDELYVLLGGTE